MTSFVGRRRDTAEVVRLLSSSRLVTLTGIGGVGKTRLALHVAETRRRAFTGGAWWVELSDLSDPDLLAVAVMQAIGVEQQATGTANDARPPHSMPSHHRSFRSSRWPPTAYRTEKSARNCTYRTGRSNRICTGPSQN